MQANQESSRLRNQGIHATAPGGGSYSARTGRPTRLIPSRGESRLTVFKGGTPCSLVRFWGGSPPARAFGHQGDDLLTHMDARAKGDDVALLAIRFTR